MSPRSHVGPAFQAGQVAFQAGRAATLKAWPYAYYRPLAVVDVPVAVSLIGWTKAPLPTESHAAKRTHFLPVASNGIVNLCLPKAGRSVAEIICRSVFCPSPQTTSTNSSGNVHSTSAEIVRFAPV